MWSKQTQGSAASARHLCRHFWKVSTWPTRRCWIDYGRQLVLSGRSQVSDDVSSTTINTIVIGHQHLHRFKLLVVNKTLSV
jgi:hypothetical protein